MTKATIYNSRKYETVYNSLKYETIGGGERKIMSNDDNGNGDLTASKISGGYILLARKMWDGVFSDWPPHFREMWLYLLDAANHKDIFYKGRIVKRGQCVRSYSDIIEALAWHIGWRKHTYKNPQCGNFMKAIRNAGMATTEKTTKGITITICNYDYYQSPENYKSHQREPQRELQRKPCTRSTINKNRNTILKKHGAFFNSLWEKYPPRNGRRKYKSEAYDYFRTNFLPADFLSLEAAVENYADCGDTRRGIGIMDMIRFLRPRGRGNKKIGAPWTEWTNNPNNCASVDHTYDEECKKNMAELKAVKIIKNE